MSSCIVVLYMAASLAAQNGSPDPDALYAQRQVLSSAQGAADIWESRLRDNPRDFDTAWKLARAEYWLGGHAPEATRKQHLEDGIAAARAAIAVEPKRPEGYFWLAANMGALAESHGMRAGLRYRKPIRDALETALKLDPGYQDGSPDRALGRWYYRVPGLFGGSNRKSEAHLRKSLTYDATNHASLYYLAETLADMGRTTEARETAQKLIDAPIDPAWAPEDQEFKEKARHLLAHLR